jgi:hypothetical protein
LDAGGPSGSHRFQRKVDLGSWGQKSRFWALNRPPQIAALQDVFGIELPQIFAHHADPTVAELVAAYQADAEGANSLQGIADVHALYGKPALITDAAFASYPNAAMGEVALFELQPGNFPPVDYHSQANLYQAFFQVLPTLDPAWFLGAKFGSIDRLPYSCTSLRFRIHRRER